MDTNEKYALFKVKDTSYAIPVSQVREIINLVGKITAVPDAPKNRLGIINLRGTTIPVYDTRGIMGHDSLNKEREQLIGTLQQREEDHKNWLDELKNCCEENREFKLQRNSHLCAFGKWYETYLADSNVNYEIRSHLAKFAEPHQEIHGLADKVDALLHQNDQASALELIDNAKYTTLAKMLTLFADFYEMINEQSEKDVALVISCEDKVGAFPVDKIDSIDYLSEITPLNLFSSSKLVSHYGKKDDKTILILDLEAIF